MSEADIFSQAFGFELPALVNFVGGGGKTGLILRLAAEHSAHHNVIYTTTTRIHPPHLENGLTLLSCDRTDWLSLLVHRIARRGSHFRSFVLTDLALKPQLLKGVPNDFAHNLDRSLFPVVLNEADGAASYSIKATRENEPVLMEGAEYLVPVIGLDCLNRFLGPEVVFRWEIAVKNFGLQAGTRLDAGLAASILLHPHGVCKGWKAETRIIPCINKVDSEAEEGMARELAREIMRNGFYPIERVVIASVQNLRAMKA